MPQVGNEPPLGGWTIDIAIADLIPSGREGFRETVGFLDGAVLLRLWLRRSNIFIVTANALCIAFAIYT